MKRNLTILLSLLLTFSANATEPVKNLAVWTKDGTKVVYSLSENPKITFTETDLLITTNGVEINYALKNMARFVYEKSDATGITDLSTNEPSFKFNGEYLLFPALKANSTVSIHNLNGTLAFKKKVTTAGEYAVSLSNLGRGIYIVNVNGLTYKITKR